MKSTQENAKKSGTEFTAQWNVYAPLPDPYMTRERAAKMIRAWRRNARQPSNHAKWTLKRNSLHSFTVSAPGYPNEFHTMAWTDRLGVIAKMPQRNEGAHA